MNIFLAGSVVKFKWEHPCGGYPGVVIRDTRYKNKIVVELHDGTLVATDPRALVLLRGPIGRKDKEDIAHKMGMAQRELQGVEY